MKEHRTIRIGVVGISHKLADLKLREKLAKACQKRFGPLQAIQENHYFVLLSTCNRTEIYFSSEDLAEAHSYILNILRLDVEEEFDHKLYSYFGVDCFTHLARVTTGLESAIIAETEIQGQVKKAYESATEYHPLPSEIHFLFQKGLKIAKKIRTDLELGRGMPSLEHAILQTGSTFFKQPEKTQILLVGASDINQRILSFLKTKKFEQLTLCNRSDQHSVNFANQYGIRTLSWNELHYWVEFDWIIFGTKSTEYLIKKDEINRKLLRNKLIMDLCVPRNVEPRVGQNSKITLLNVDQINRLLKIRHSRMNHILNEADIRICNASLAYANRYAEKTKKTFAAI